MLPPGLVPLYQSRPSSDGENDLRAHQQGVQEHNSWKHVGSYPCWTGDGTFNPVYGGGQRLLMVYRTSYLRTTEWRKTCLGVVKIICSNACVLRRRLLTEGGAGGAPGKLLRYGILNRRANVVQIFASPKHFVFSYVFLSCVSC